MRVDSFVLAAAALVLGLTAATGTAQDTDPNAVIFWNVIKDCTNKDPSWSVSAPLANWSGTESCPGPNCFFTMPVPCNGPINLKNLTSWNYFFGIGFYQSGVTGTVDLTELPSNLYSLVLSHNQLFGSVDLTQLPRSLYYLMLAYNNFSGSVDFTQTPYTIQYIEIQNNDFSGTVNLTNLPGDMNRLNIANNSFSGTPDLSLWVGRDFSSVGLWSLDNNSFTGTVSINATQAPGGSYFQLGLSGNPLFALWVCAADGQNIPSIIVDPSVHRYATALGTAPLRVGVFTSSASKHALRLSSSGSAKLGSCEASIPSGLWQVFTDGSGFVADSGVVAAALVPCLPSEFGTPEYFLHPSTATLLLVTSGGQNITFTRRSG